MIVIGAGASAMMFCSLLDKGISVALIEQNSSIGQKVKISGGGKCNITNAKVNESNYLGEQRFVASVLDRYDNSWLLDFLEQSSLIPLLKKDNCYFCKDSSSEILDLFHKKMGNVKKIMNTVVQKVTKKDNVFLIKSNRGEFRSHRVVIASGSKSYPRIGGSDIGLLIAKHFGHSVKEFEASLVGFTVQPEQFWFKQLSGISFDISAKVGDKSFSGSLLFAHKGISGPVVLNLSLYWKRGQIEIDFLNKKPVKKFLSSSKKLISSSLPLPKRFVKLFLESIKVEDKPVNSLTNEELEKLALLNRYSFAPAGNFGFSKAEACRGGVETSEINSYTLESKKVEGLYFLGEVMDVTGELGGYNLQWAFSSAAVCAEHFNATLQNTL